MPLLLKRNASSGIRTPFPGKEWEQWNCHWTIAAIASVYIVEKDHLSVTKDSS